MPTVTPVEYGDGVVEVGGTPGRNPVFCDETTELAPLDAALILAGLGIV